MRATRSCVALGSAVALALGVVGCGSGGAGGTGSGSGGDDETFRILQITTLSGPLGVYGSAQQKGVAAAVDVLNAAGGIDGRRVEVSVKDMGGDSSKGVTLLQQAMNSGNRPDLVIPGLTGTDALAMVPITTQQKIITLTPPPVTVLGDPGEYPYNFVTNPAYGFIGKTGAEIMYDEGVRTVVTISSDNDPGRDNTDGFTETFEGLGGQVLASEVFDPAAVDLTSTFERAKSKDPDALYVVSQGEGAAELKANAATGQDVPMYCDAGCASDFRAQGVSQAQLANTFGLAIPITVANPANRTERMTEFVEALAAAGGDESAGFANPGLQYDGIMLVAQAATQAGSVDPDEVVAAMEDLEGDTTWSLGVTYHYTSDAGTGHFALQPDDPPAHVLFPLDAPFEDGHFVVDGP